MPLPPPPPAHVQLLTGADVWTAQGPQKGQAVAILKGKILAVGSVEASSNRTRRPCAWISPEAPSCRA